LGDVDEEGVFHGLAAREVLVDCATEVFIGIEGQFLAMVSRNHSDGDVGRVKVAAKGVAVFAQNRVFDFID